MKSVSNVKTPKDILECLEVVPLPPGDNVWKWYKDNFLKGVVELDLEFLFSHAGDRIYFKVMIINPFYTTGLFLYPLNALENQGFSDVFRGYRKKPVTWNGLSGSMMNLIIPSLGGLNT